MDPRDNIEFDELLRSKDFEALTVQEKTVALRWVESAEMYNELRKFAQNAEKSLKKEAVKAPHSMHKNVMDAFDQAHARREEISIIPLTASKKGWYRYTWVRIAAAAGLIGIVWILWPTSPGPQNQYAENKPKITNADTASTTPREDEKEVEVPEDSGNEPDTDRTQTDQVLKREKEQDMIADLKDAPEPDLIFEIEEESIEMANFNLPVEEDTVAEEDRLLADYAVEKESKTAASQRDQGDSMAEVVEVKSLSQYQESSIEANAKTNRAQMLKANKKEDGSLKLLLSMPGWTSDHYEAY